MKLITVLLVTIFSINIFAATPTRWKNDALGFTIVASTSTDVIEICNTERSCIQFEPTDSSDSSDGMTEYTELSMKCKITMELVNASYRDGSRDQFMLDIAYQVVRVKEGNENCKLETEFSGERGLTGIYL